MTCGSAMMQLHADMRLLDRLKTSNGQLCEVILEKYPHRKSHIGLNLLTKVHSLLTYMVRHKTQLSTDHVTEHSRSGRQQFDT
jgi:hypothetical protein